MADVPRAFDPGASVLRPVRIALREKGVETRYLILLTSNIRPTIDPEHPESVGYGSIRRPALMCEGKVHPGGRAFRAAVEGPAIWTDPGVVDTLFVNDALAQALLAEPFGRDLQLKQVRLVEARKGLPKPEGPSA